MKYRDEIRPRLGLLRGREFIMKDLYTFDKTEELALKTYDENEINESLKLQANADTGNIGGTKSHEFHYLSAVGEDLILYCTRCGYSSNEERATGILPTPSTFSDINPTMKIGITNDKRRFVIILGSGRELNAFKLKEDLPGDSIELLNLGDHENVKEYLRANLTSTLNILVDKTFSADILSLDSLLRNEVVNEVS
ncbi:12923_t:CDS:2 [Acaulospora colombiana]|uniref:12923_t:CDS:1 n=1 Tax=Acaulospora colombiana TaxID=27376 RepID=A0ACA9LHT1_9GLOM|nr:12923_t:CDS:2 [Acaulospora colombiana]